MKTVQDQRIKLQVGATTRTQDEVVPFRESERIVQSPSLLHKAIGWWTCWFDHGDLGERYRLKVRIGSVANRLEVIARWQQYAIEI